MKHTLKRTLSLILAFLMLLSLSACGEKQPDTPNTEGVTLTIAVEADDEVIDWDTNLTTLMLEEEFGVDLQFEVYAAGTFSDKLNVMIQGGEELPDIIFGSSTKGLNAYQASWVDAGAILDLTEYYNNPDYAKYTNIAMEQVGTRFIDTLRDADGKIWAVPKYYPNNNDATAYRLWINTEYAKACGFEELPTTTEGFFELCKAFAAAGDLNGNGLDDEYVFTGKSDPDEPWFKFLMSAFVYAWDDHRAYVEDGKIKLSYATEGWKEGLKYIKRFFDEGLIDTTILTQDKSAFNAICQNPEMLCLAQFNYYAQPKGANNYETMKLRLAYDYVTALEGPSREALAYYGDPLAYPGAMITVDCENPDVAFIVLDYMMSETMGLYQRYGEEGVDWDYWENVDPAKIIDGTTVDMIRASGGTGEPRFLSYTNTTYWGTGTPQNKGYMLAGPGIQFPGADGRAMTGGANDEARTTAQFWGMYFGECIPDMLKQIPEERIVSLPLTAEENAAITESLKVLDKYWQEAAANFVTGAWDIDEQWDSYLAELEKIGMNDILTVWQTAYDRSK